MNDNSISMLTLRLRLNDPAVLVHHVCMIKNFVLRVGVWHGSDLRIPKRDGISIATEITKVHLGRSLSPLTTFSSVLSNYETTMLTKDTERLISSNLIQRSWNLSFKSGWSTISQCHASLRFANQMIFGRWYWWSFHLGKDCEPDNYYHTHFCHHDQCLLSGEMPTRWLTYTWSSCTIQSFELKEKRLLSWVFRAKETLKVVGMIEGKENLDRNLASAYDESCWLRPRMVRSVLSPASWTADESRQYKQWWLPIPIS